MIVGVKSSRISTWVFRERQIQRHMSKGVWGHAFIMHAYGPTVSITLRKSALLVRSTLTAKLDFLRSIVSKSSFAAALDCFVALRPYDLARRTSAIGKESDRAQPHHTGNFLLSCPPILHKPGNGSQMTHLMTGLQNEQSLTNPSVRSMLWLQPRRLLV